MSELIATLKQSMKNAMRAKDKVRLSTVRMILAEIKKIEVDERIELNDEQVIAILDKMKKQRNDSLTQFLDANRKDLAAIEKTELEVISSFLPAALTESELNDIITQAIADSDAQSMKDMGSVMALIRPQASGRADMADVSKIIKQRLT